MADLKNWWSEPITAENSKPISSQRAMTIKRKKMVENGWHPFGGRLQEPLVNKCGECRFAVQVHHGGFKGWKCQRYSISRSATSDLRISWPACILFEDKEKERI